MFGYYAYCGLKANSLVILCNCISCKGTELKSDCFVYSDNVEKECKYNQYISISSTDSHASLQKNSVVPRKHASEVWRYFEDNLDGVIAKCSPCKYNQTKGDPLNHHWNDGNITSLSSPFLPSSSKWSSQCKLLHLNLSGSPPRRLS